MTEASHDFEIKGLSVRFEDVRREGDRVKGKVTIEWEESIAGHRIVILRNSFPFDIQGRHRLWEDSIDIIWGIKVRAHVDVYLEGTNRVCIEARAIWPGGNAGKIDCKTF